jgi:hypothetical protein
MLKKNAFAETPKTQPLWFNLSAEERLELINEKIRENTKYNKILPKKASGNGNILVSLTEVIPAAKRGCYLLDFERYLKDNLDKGINIWCEPIGDKNSLRNLRGIEIKS